MEFKIVTNNDTHTWVETSMPSIYHGKVYLCSKCKSYKVYQDGIIWNLVKGVGSGRKRDIDFGTSVIERHVTTSCDDELINQILDE